MTGAADRLFDVVVLGAGPSGVTAALGLTRLGYSAAVLARPRSAAISESAVRSSGISSSAVRSSGIGSSAVRSSGIGSSAVRASALEGLSARTLAGLREAGLAAVASCASNSAGRVVHWAGEVSERGRESLIERAQLEQSLRDSLEGVVLIDAAARNVRPFRDLWHVETAAGPVRGRMILDARGRHARRSDCRGPLLVAWSVSRSAVETSEPASALVALEDGWCWFARTGWGTSSLQFVGSAAKARGPSELGARLNAVANAMPQLRGDLELLSGADDVLARAAVARYSQPSRGPGFLRIGDAAVAMDPLSGNGIHEALRSGRVAVAAVNSYLQGTPWPIVSRFVDERARELWRRSIVTAAGFYGLQASRSGGEFWTRTAAAYEDAAAGAVLRHEGPERFELRPVLNGDRIDLRRVWVCEQWPRGVWKVDGHDLGTIPAEQIPILMRRAVGDVRTEVSR